MIQSDCKKKNWSTAVNGGKHETRQKVFRETEGDGNRRVYRGSIDSKHSSLEKNAKYFVGWKKKIF